MPRASEEARIKLILDWIVHGKDVPDTAVKDINKVKGSYRSLGSTLKAAGYSEKESINLRKQARSAFNQELIGIGKKIAGLNLILKGQEQYNKRQKAISEADEAGIPLIETKQTRAPVYKGIGEMSDEEKDKYYATGEAPIKRRGTTTSRKLSDDERIALLEAWKLKQSLAKKESKMMDEELKKQAGYRKDASDAAIIGLRKQGEEQVKSQKRLDKLTGSFRSSGIRLGWLGYRMVSIGRLMTKYLQSPILQLINTFKNWQETMLQMGLSMGLMTMFGMGGSDMAGTFADTLAKLPLVGLQVQMAFGALAGLLATIGVDLIPLLIPAFMKLIATILSVWREVSPTVIPMFKDFINSILPTLLNLIKEVGPAFVVNFAKGILFAAGALIKLIEFLKPIIPHIGTFLGLLVGFSPIIVAAGTALFMISLPLQALGSLLGVIGPLGTMFTGVLGKLGIGAVGATGAIGGLGGGLGGLAGIFGTTGAGAVGLVGLLGPIAIIAVAIAGVVATLVAWWNELTAVWNATVGPAISRLWEALTGLWNILFGNIDAMGILKIVTAPLAGILAAVMWVVGKLVDLWTLFWDAITIVADAIKKALMPAFQKLYEFFKPLVDGIKWVWDQFAGLFDWLDKGWNDMVGTVHSQAQSLRGETEQAGKDAGEAMGQGMQQGINDSLSGIDLSGMNIGGYNLGSLMSGMESNVGLSGYGTGVGMKTVEQRLLEVKAELSKIEQENKVFNENRAKVGEEAYKQAIEFQNEKQKKLNEELKMLESGTNTGIANLTSQNYTQLSNLQAGVSTLNTTSSGGTQLIVDAIKALAAYLADRIKELSTALLEKLNQIHTSLNTMNTGLQAQLTAIRTNTQQAASKAAEDRPNETMINTTVNFNGPISSNVDIEKITDTINKKIGEELRRRRL